MTTTRQSEHTASRPLSTARDQEEPVPRSWREWQDAIDRRPVEVGFLEEQRTVLAAIVFSRAGADLMQQLEPADFDGRNYRDWHQPVGTLEVIAEAAWAMWEETGEPPGLRLIDRLPEALHGYVKGLERHVRPTRRWLNNRGYVELTARQADRATTAALQTARGTVDEYANRVASAAEDEAAHREWLRTVRANADLGDKQSPRRRRRVRTSSRRARIEAALVAGKSISTVAEAEGVSRQYVHRVASQLEASTRPSVERKLEA